MTIQASPLRGIESRQLPCTADPPSWESTDILDHRAAADGCSTCPEATQAFCRQLGAEVNGTGTWGGLLLIRGETSRKSGR